MTVINKGYSEFKLDNGLIVALQEKPTQTISAKLRVNYGPFHEMKGEEGLAHYLEHCLVTGGSEKYDPLCADEIRGSFGHSNAFTSLGRTFFIGQMLNEDLDIWLDYISEHIFRPRFDKSRIEGERERVLREISDAKSNPAYLANKEFKNIFYGCHPKGRFNFGREEVIKNTNQKIIKEFHNRGYKPNNMDLIIVGGLPNNIEDAIRNYFGKILPGKNMRKKFPKLNPLNKKTILRRPAPERFNIDNPQESSAQIVLHYLGPISGQEDECAVRAMNQILGGDTNSLLFKNMGLKKGLAYSLDTSYNGDYNCGELGITAFVPVNRIDEAVDAIFEEMDNMKTQKQDVKDIDRIKKMSKYNLIKSFESNEGHISIIELKLDEELTPESYIDGFDKVTSEKIMEVANKYLPDRENGKYVLYIRDPLKQNE